MGEENGRGKEKMRMGEMEEGRAMAVEVARERFYPCPLYSHEDVVKDRGLFMDSMSRFHHSMGTKLSIPVLGGKDIDLHRLYREVTQRGGLEKVILEKKFREIVMAFSFSPTTTSASFVLRKHYLSLLYHYEQVYFFRAQGPPIPPTASCLTKTPKIKLERPPDASELITMKKRRGRKRKHAETRSKEPDHFRVTGSVERKFEHGYFVTVKVGQETLNGVVFHVEKPREASSSTSVLPPVSAAAMKGALTEAKRRKKKRCRSSDPAQPKPNRSAYNFYFAEQYVKLKALYPDRDKEFSKMIGESWRRLDAEEKQVYLNRGVEDKVRYRREMEEYGEKQKLQQLKEVTEVELSNAKNNEAE